MFFQKTKYKPKVGDMVLVWNTTNYGKEQTRVQHLSKNYYKSTCRKVITGLTKNSINFSDNLDIEWRWRDFYFLELINNES